MLGGSGQKNQMSQDGQTKALTIIIIFFKKKGLNKKTETKPQVEANIHNSKKVRNQAPRLAVKWNVVETNVKKGASFLQKPFVQMGPCRYPPKLAMEKALKTYCRTAFNIGIWLARKWSRHKYYSGAAMLPCNYRKVQPSLLVVGLSGTHNSICEEMYLAFIDRKR